MNFAPLIFGAATLGLLYAWLAWATFVSLRGLRFADITVDGSFVLGGAVAGTLMVHGQSPWLGCAAALGAGFCAGLATGLIHTKLGINDLLSGILVMTGLYSINLRIMGRANLPLLNTSSLLDSLPASLSKETGWLALAAGFAALGAGALVWFLRTDFGLALRAAGDGPSMLAAQGVPPQRMKLIGLAISNALAALGGCLVSQYQGFVDINMGIGMLLVGIAAVVIGESGFGRLRFTWMVGGCAVGAIVYRVLMAAAISAKIEPTDLRLVTALLVLGALALPSIRRKVMAR
jgi:putative ABC transport system permease protein